MLATVVVLVGAAITVSAMLAPPVALIVTASVGAAVLISAAGHTVHAMKVDKQCAEEGLMARHQRSAYRLNGDGFYCNHESSDSDDAAESRSFLEEKANGGLFNASI